jgi:hypothetical protein
MPSKCKATHLFDNPEAFYLTIISITLKTPNRVGRPGVRARAGAPGVGAELPLSDTWSLAKAVRKVGSNYYTLNVI